MWFLIKGTFWFSMVLVALSFFNGETSDENRAGKTLEVADAVTAASGAYQYLSKICLEKPEVCEKGAETFNALGQRAREGAYVAFQFLDKQLAGDGVELAAGMAGEDSDDLEAIVTGTVAPKVPVPLAKPALR